MLEPVNARFNKIAKILSVNSYATTTDYRPKHPLTFFKSEFLRNSISWTSATSYDAWVTLQIFFILDHFIKFSIPFDDALNSSDSCGRDI